MIWILISPAITVTAAGLTLLFMCRILGVAPEQAADALAQVLYACSGNARKSSGDPAASVLCHNESREPHCEHPSDAGGVAMPISSS